MSAEAHPPPADTPHGDRYVTMQTAPEFVELRRAFRTFVLPLTVAFLAWYLLYVVMSAYARGFLDTKVVGHINIAFVFGLLQFVSTFLIAWLYSRYAARRLDPLATRIKNDVEKGASVADATEEVAG